MFRTIKSVYNYPQSGKGIFDLIDDLPWGDEISPDELNMLYFFNQSGSKFCSPIVLQSLSDGELSTTAKTFLAALIYSKYKNKWDRLWSVYTAQYNPIHNYDMSETVTDGVIKSETRNGSVNNTNSKNRTLSNDGKDYAYGFNTQSDDGDPASAYESGGTDNLSENLAEVSSDTMSGSVNGTKTTTRSGNIGVTTSQQMIEAEIKLRGWDFFNTIFSDVDKVLTIPFYDLCQISQL